MRDVKPVRGKMSIIIPHHVDVSKEAMCPSEKSDCYLRIFLKTMQKHHLAKQISTTYFSL